MLIHQCVECARLSINRIAADDDPDRILELFESSQSLDSEMRERLDKGGIALLDPMDKSLIRDQLFGRN